MSQYNSRILINAILGVFVASSIFSMFWISDEFDATRIKLASILGMPAVVLLIFHEFANLSEPLSTYTRRTIVCGVLIAFSWGNVMLLNALETTRDGIVVTNNVGGTAMNVDRQMGAFGLIFRKRW